MTVPNEIDELRVENRTGKRRSKLARPTVSGTYTVFIGNYDTFVGGVYEQLGYQLKCFYSSSATLPQPYCVTLTDTNCLGLTEVRVASRRRRRVFYFVVAVFHAGDKFQIYPAWMLLLYHMRKSPAVIHAGVAATVTVYVSLTPQSDKIKIDSTRQNKMILRV